MKASYSSDICVVSPKLSDGPFPVETNFGGTQTSCCSIPLGGRYLVIMIVVMIIIVVIECLSLFVSMNTL